MTLRPFKITATNTKKKGEVYTIKTHRDEVVAKEIKLGKKAFEKLLYYPITAFGYDLTTYLQLKSDNINPKFDKKDVIKALDFWIEYFVYQNKCDYILEGTVSTEFELHLEELIRVREAVLKESVDTKYVRQKIRSPISQEELRGGGHDTNFDMIRDGIRKYYKYDAIDNREITNMTEQEIINIQQEIGKMFKRKKPLFQPASDQIIEFTENVLDTSNNLPFSTVDQFCYKVRIMTRKEYENYTIKLFKNTPMTVSEMVRSIQGSWSTSFTGAARAIEDLTESIRILEGSAGTVPEDIQRAARFGDPEDETSFTLHGAQHSDLIDSRGNWVNTDLSNNPNTWTAVRGRNEVFWRVVDSNGRNIATDFTSIEGAQTFIEQAQEQFLPSEVGTVPEAIRRAATFENPDTGVTINSSSSALAGKRISRVNIRVRREGEPTGSIG